MVDLTDDTAAPVDDSAALADETTGTPAPMSRDATPSVLAVVVSHEPGEWFEETLESVATQDYPRFEVVVVDAAGDPGIGERVHAVLPGASVLDASDTVGFSQAADAILDTDVDPAFLLFCHDDVALAPDAVRLMVVESLRSNCAIAGPKLVDWDHPERLQHVAYTVDRFAAVADVVDPGELDQEQYDSVRDVFAVPSACLMIRTGLFRTLEGFDPAITHRGEDVDLCWRAQLAGARVMVIPDARVRHRERLTERSGIDDVRRTRARHQLRTVAVTASRPSLFVTLPLFALLTLGEAAVAFVTARFGQVRDVFAAWTWNARRLREIRQRRARLRTLVRARHSDVRALQETGSVRINAFVRGQIGRSGGGGRQFATAARTGTGRMAAIVGGFVALFVVFGSRALLTDGVPAIGDFVAVGESPGRLLADWWSGWRDRDLGAPGVIESGGAIIAVVGAVLGGSLGLARTLWVLAPIGVGLYGAWRLPAVTGSRRAQIGSLLAYVVVPLPWAAVATASIGGIYAYAGAPWLLAGLLHAQAAAPFRSTGGPWRRFPRAVVGVAVPLGAMALFEPAAGLVLVVFVAGLLVSALLNANPVGTLRLLVTSVVATVFAGLLVLPFVVDLLVTAPTWAPFADGHDGSASERPLTDLLRFAVAPDRPGPLLFLWVLPMAVPLLLGRSWRFALAVRGWAVALTAWGLAWASVWGVLPFGLPDETVLLAPAAAATALVAAAAVAAVEHDLRGARFGWRQALVPLAVGCAAVGALPTLALAESGRWGLPRGDFTTALPFADPEADGSYRVLWVGAPSVLPATGRHLVDDLAWVATLDGGPSFDDRRVVADDGAAPLVEEALTLALDGETLRIGRVLGGLGIRYVVLLERLAPAPFSPADHAVPVPDAVADAMAAQLDLRRLEGVNSAMEVYANSEWVSVRAAAAPGFDDGRHSVVDLARQPLTGTAGVLPGEGDHVSGFVPGGAEIFVGQTPDSGWELAVDGVRAAQRRSLGWASAYLPEQGGTGSLSYTTPWWRHAALLAQVLVLVAASALGLRRLVGPAR